MLIEQLDRTSWKLEQASKHITTQLLSIAQEDTEVAGERIVRMAPWQHGQSPQERAREEARYELLMALRDGDLHATGRLSTQRPAPWHTAHAGWRPHSGHQRHITPEQWRGGEMEWGFGMLTMSDGQFIDIRVPRFAVLAIWPERRETVRTMEYRSPYLGIASSPSGA